MFNYIRRKKVEIKFAFVFIGLTILCYSLIFFLVGLGI